jgi:N-carbamoylputrescine amidase
VGFEASPVAADPGIEFWGSSFACGPQGEWLARAGLQAETLLVDLDLGRSDAVRCVWPFLRDRRIDDYQDLLERFID